MSTQPRSLALHCQSAGFIVRPVVSPTVPQGTERVRVCLHSGNTTEQIDRFVDCVKEWLISQRNNSFQIEQLDGSYSHAEDTAGKAVIERRLAAKL